MRASPPPNWPAETRACVLFPAPSHLLQHEWMQRLQQRWRCVCGRILLPQTGKRGHRRLLLRLQRCQVLLRRSQQLFPVWVRVHVVAEVRSDYAFLKYVWPDDITSYNHINSCQRFQNTFKRFTYHLLRHFLMQREHFICSCLLLKIWSNSVALFIFMVDVI